MLNLLSNRFLDFLTAKIGETPIPIWVALTAVAAMVIIIAIIIGVSTGKNKKKTKTDKESQQEPLQAEVAENKPTEEVEEFAFETVEEEYLDPNRVAEKPLQVAKDEPFIAMPEEIEEKPLVEEKKEEINIRAEEFDTIDQEEKEVIIEQPVKPIAKPLVKADEEVQAMENKPVELPAYSLDTKETKTIAKPIAKPIAKKIENEQTMAKAQEPNQEVVKEEIKPIAKPVVKPIAKLENKKAEEEKPVAKIVTKVEPKKAEEEKPVAKIATKVAPKKAEESKPVAKVATKVEPKKAEESKPVAKVVPKIEPKKVEEEKSVVKTLEDDKEGTFGKYVITENDSNPVRPFVFTLIANNGQLLFESEPFKVKPRETSIAAFKKHVKEGVFAIDEDKQGNFRYKLYSTKNVLIGVGETYKTRSSCDSSIESVKRFAESATVIEDKTTK